MSVAETLKTQPEAEKWQRLAPAAMIHFAVQFVMQFLKQGIQGLLPLGAVFLTAGDKRWMIIGVAAGAVAVLLIVGAILSYLKFRFRLSGDKFLIQRGVISRKRLSLSYDRIQNIAFKEPIYFRPFGLVVLGIESAGSSGKEVDLGGIPRTLAEEIRRTVFVKKSLTANTDAETDETTEKADNQTDEDGELVIALPVPELVRYGLTNNNMFVFAGIGAGAMAQIDWDDWSILANTKDSIEAFTATHSNLANSLLAISIFLGLFAFLMSLSVIGSIISNYGYRLSDDGERFHRKKGLFERQETSLPERKIQSLIIAQNWAARLLNRFVLNIRQIGFASVESGELPGSGNRFLVPSVTFDFAAGFTKRLFPNFDWSYDKLKPIDPAFTRKIVLWIMLPISFAPAISLSLTFSPLGLLALLVPFLLAPIVMQIRRRYGYWTDGQHGIVRTGFIGHKLTLFPFYKVQTVEVSQTPGQRQNGLASITIKLAGNSVEVPYIPLEDATYWRDRILYEVERQNGTWM